MQPHATRQGSLISTVVAFAAVLLVACGDRPTAPVVPPPGSSSRPTQSEPSAEADRTRRLCEMVKANRDRAPDVAVRALKQLAATEVLPEEVDVAVSYGLGSSDFRVVTTALDAVRRRSRPRDDQTRDLVRSLLSSEDRAVRMNAVIAVGLLEAQERDVRLLTGILVDEGQGEFVRCNAALSLSHCQLRSLDADVRNALARAGESAPPTLGRYIKEGLDRLDQPPAQRARLLARWRESMRRQ